MQKKPPSRLKYEKNHPTISLRISKELKDVIEEIRAKSGDSYAEIIKSGLKNVEDSYNFGYKDGYAKAKEDWQITYPCSICTAEIPVSPGSEAHKALIKALKNEGWGHQACIRQAEGF
ncbi:MAG: hypothetical protein KAW47_00215 [Thermoplasmatales archaeon]|nr:hypothetical protein [Thermoplasmatales archaeon]